MGQRGPGIVWGNDEMVVFPDAIIHFKKFKNPIYLFANSLICVEKRIVGIYKRGRFIEISGAYHSVTNHFLVFEPFDNADFGVDLQSLDPKNEANVLTLQ